MMVFQASVVLVERPAPRRAGALKCLDRLPRFSSAQNNFFDFLFSCKDTRGHDNFHIIYMKDRIAELLASRKQLVRQMPDPATILPGSLLHRMVRCYKPGCRFCEKGKGKGHGPICILSVSLGNRQVRQVAIPDARMPEVEEGLCAFAQTLKQIAQINLDLLKERKRRRQ